MAVKDKPLKFCCNCLHTDYNLVDVVRFLDTEGGITELSRPGFSIKT